MSSSPDWVSVTAFAACVVVAATARSLKERRRRSRRRSPPLTSLTKAETLEIRRRHFSSSLSVSYANTGPLMIVKGEGSRLIDEGGASYLDTRNNVAHCGHGHPLVVAAVQEQVAAVNTNTRYLHPAASLLARRLASLLPDNLDTVFFCNSGSEANDLALRLAGARTGSANTIVVDGAYHGHTSGCLEVSPYKYGREGGGECALGKPAPTAEFATPGRHVWRVPCPDVYRGRHRDPRAAGRQYARYVREACRFYQRTGEKVRAFIVEGGMSVAGVVLPPPGYLAEAVRAVREAGGLYVADEVQTGFGRLGSCFWAFQHNQPPEVVPDIVTVGKPFGNGMPLAAVITTREVANAFEQTGVEYFNTFGGNPVCAAAGLAVLDVIEMEGLQQHALRVGNHLKRKLRDLQQKIDLIGDVRGSGLFLGIELVRDRQTLEPAEAETSLVCSLLKSKYHILTSIDGLHDNVLVIKPPMVFSIADADYFVKSFEEVLMKDLLAAGDLSKVSRTPT